MAAHMRDLERRLQCAEAFLQSHRQSLGRTASAERIRDLEGRLQRAELSASQAQFVTESGTSGLEQRVQIVEQRIKPHLEVLPPYVPSK